MTFSLLNLLKVYHTPILFHPCEEFGSSASPLPIIALTIKLYDIRLVCDGLSNRPIIPNVSLLLKPGMVCKVQINMISYGNIP